MELNYKYIATDQYNNLVWIKQHPRKELCQHHGVKHADKCYIDIEGVSHHVGYVVSSHWYDVFRIAPLEGVTQ